ncbi:MAG: hypothetical protein EOO77_21515 [Oxalobacteraceae bacterium]|nr:MAG: hypothetical protein EOO77_21515 [Oxalobacteraceae bacterium]
MNRTLYLEGDERDIIATLVSARQQGFPFIVMSVEFVQATGDLETFCISSKDTIDGWESAAKSWPTIAAFSDVEIIVRDRDVEMFKLLSQVPVMIK